MPILRAMFLSDLLPASIAWQPADGDLVLLAAHVDDLALIETLLATLPEKARGQVFIETDEMDEAVQVAAPGRVCVTWLSRSRGQSLRTAVDAWTAEMLPMDSADCERDREHRVYAWMSGDRAARVITSG
jgi:NADPH-dependent ferric siderophore reductase